MSSPGRMYKCEVCNKDFTRKDHLEQHSNAIHLGVKYPCDKCDYKATVPGILKIHMRSKHDGIKMPCSQCDHKAFDLSSLNKHMKQVHLGLKPYNCDHCDFQTTTNSNLKLHIKRNHNQTGDSFQCQECKYETKVHVDLMSHKRRHKQAKNSHLCDLCDYKTTWVENLKDHKRKVHIQEKVRCGLCDFSSLSRSTIYKHKQNMHNTKTFHCDKCDHVANSSNLLISHKGKVHRVKQEFPCGICTKVYYWQETLKRHMDRVHSGSPKVKQCGMCEKVYSQQGALNFHIKFTHREEKIPCNQCDLTFSNLSALCRHKNIIHMGKTFQCNICPKKVLSKKCLERHIERKHKLISQIPEEKSYVCKLCPYKTDSQGKLGRHAKSHWSKKRYTCHLCSKSLSSFKNLSRHLLYHSNPSTAYHNCTHCSFYSPNKAGLAKHLRDSHNICEKYNCPLCKKTLANQKNLNIHLKFHSRKGVSHHKCSKCFFHSASKFLLERHIREVHNIKKLNACLKCDTKLELKKDFLLHMKNFHPKISKREEQTGKGLKKNVMENSRQHTSKKDLNTHKPSDIFSGEKGTRYIEIHPCKICAKTFKTRKEMKNHLKRHGDFPCVKCSKSFSLKSELLSSKHLCNNTKKVSCALCEKSFKFTVAMKRHVKAFHLKERKFKCKICPKAYTDPTPLRHHTNASHGDGSTLYDCIQCKKKFTTKRRFLEHNDKYHKETIEEKKSEVDE